MNDREHNPAEKNHLYILGAGASFAEDNRFPLLNNAFNDEEMEINLSDYDRLKEWLQNNFEDYKKANLEEVFTYLDFLRDQYVYDEAMRDETINIEIQIIYNELIRYVQRILDPTEDSSNLDLYNKLVERVEPNDSIISFNYDELIEFAIINRMGNDSENPPPQLINLQYLISNLNKNSLFRSLGDVPRSVKGRGILLKLHGSLYWSSCTTKGCPNSYYINMSNENNDFLNEDDYFANPGFSMFPDDPPYCGMCGGKLERVFIYPSATKKLDSFPKMRLIWQEANSVLRLATHFVIIGYSFPETDVHVRNLVKNACYFGKGRSWRIVDPNWEQVAKKLKPLIYKQSHSTSFFFRCYEGFEQYLNGEEVEGIDTEYFHNL